MAKFIIAHMQEGKFEDNILLQPETMELLHKKHSHGRYLFKLSSNCRFSGYGFGIIQYKNYWFGHGGSTIGSQSLWKFNKSQDKGYIILTNANGLLHSKENFDAVWATVSAIEKAVRLALGFSNLYRKINVLAGINAVGMGANPKSW
jgi:hypothetical protein